MQSWVGLTQRLDLADEPVDLRFAHPGRSGRGLDRGDLVGQFGELREQRALLAGEISLRQLSDDDARRQHGVFSRRQALQTGLDTEVVRRRLTRGSWVEPTNNVYADAGVRMTDAAWDWAAVLSCGDQAVLSHRSSAE